MKRQLSFDYENGCYVIKENNGTLFSINGRELKFVSLDFYTGIYKDRSAAIELTNIISNDELNKGKYIFEWLNDIVNAIQCRKKAEKLVLIGFIANRKAYVLYYFPFKKLVATIERKSEKEWLIENGFLVSQEMKAVAKATEKTEKATRAAEENTCKK